MSTTPAFQSITPHRQVRNHHVFGREIVSIRPDVDRLFASYEFAYGTLDGGCLAFGMAILEWIEAGSATENAKLVFVGRAQCTDHVAVQIPTGAGVLYIDGDGLARPSEMIRKMVVLEGLSECGIRDFDASAAKNAGLDASVEVALPLALTHLFVDRLGPFTPDRVSPAYLD